MTEKIPSDYLLKEAPQEEVEKQLAVYRALQQRGNNAFNTAIPKLEARLATLKTRALLTEKEPHKTQWAAAGTQVIKAIPKTPFN